MIPTVETCPSDQLPTATITTMDTASGNDSLVPHMRPFVPRRCGVLIEDIPSSKWMHFPSIRYNNAATATTATSTVVA